MDRTIGDIDLKVPGRPEYNLDDPKQQEELLKELETDRRDILNRIIAFLRTQPDVTDIEVDEPDGGQTALTFNYNQCDHVLELSTEVVF